MKPEVIQRYKSGDLTPSMKLFKRFVAEFQSNEKMQKHFKAIAVVNNIEKFKFLSRFEGYNGKPFILNKCVSLRRLDEENYDYLEIGVNTRLFGYVAKKMLYSFIDELKHLRFTFGVVIQAEGDEEMPENMLAVVKGHKFDIFRDSAHVKDLQ